MACASPTFCVAVGRVAVTGTLSGGQSLIETWNGTVWSQTQIGDAFNGSALSSVSCTGASDCVAVGDTWPADAFPLIESWNGTTWSVPTVTDPGIEPYGLGGLSSVSCPTSSFCMAVGSWDDFGPALGPRVDILSGQSWSAIAGPSITSGLGTVSCASPTFCMTPGFSWNGTTWSAMSSPGTPFGLSCATPTDCVAVGGNSIESWDGTSWNSAASLGATSALSGVSCTSSDYCVSVGSVSGQNLVETGLAPQAITFTSTPPFTAVDGGPNYVLGATGGGSDNPVTFSSATPSVCVVSGSTVSFVGVGTCTIDANQAGNTYFAPASTTTQNISVVKGPDVITSTDFTNATVGSSFSVSVTTTGSPTPNLKHKGALPKGVHFTDNGNGTATLFGTPTSTKHKSAAGTYTLTITATFGKGKTKQVVTQTFTLTVT